jgi:hypothetical protein
MPWFMRFYCKRCDVLWHAEENENVPDKCWLCEQSDRTEVWTQAGQVVRIPSDNINMEVAHTPKTGWRQWESETRTGVL